MELVKKNALNVIGTELLPCNHNPKTGFFRDGSCNTCKEDVGSHTVCVVMTTRFLEYSRFKGNDLSTPRPEFGFPGLQEGDQWCLCAARWLEAHNEGMAPKIKLLSTHEKALEIVPLEKLKASAIDLN
ncbi:MAG: DUF2237 domain-containing protein [Hahellaceae bacterium]|jgi:hypothetical protein|nr:DUF2237 domain-containing protein [Hahellaceae bacterium]MCP5210291.1 DUF2237 domain-containing protein [Hahellaceae bacterium]